MSWIPHTMKEYRLQNTHGFRLPEWEVPLQPPVPGLADLFYTNRITADCVHCHHSCAFHVAWKYLCLPYSIWHLQMQERTRFQPDRRLQNPTSGRKRRPIPSWPFRNLSGSYRNIDSYMPSKPVSVYPVWLSAWTDRPPLPLLFLM